MKKVLFVSLALAIGMTGFAQRASHNFKVGKDIVRTAQRNVERVVDGSEANPIQFTMPERMVTNTRDVFNDFEDFEIMSSNYDLQSNSALGNRIAVWPDGSAAFTATWDFSGSTSFPDRGTGYNFYDPANGFGDAPEERQEPMKSGWPSITKCGDGEILVSHASGTNVYYRPTKGEGDWTLVHNFEDCTWPRVVASGPNDQYVNIVMSTSSPSKIWHARSTDGGQTWSDPEEFPTEVFDNAEDGMYKGSFGADDYVMAANGNNVAVLFGSYTTDVFYLISHDNGETWEKQMIVEFPIEGEHAHDWDAYPEGIQDTLFTSDNSHAIAIDNDGTVHVVFGMFTWRPATSDTYSYWQIYNNCVLYWNSNFTNEQGGHQIPNYGDWSEDANHPDWAYNTTSGPANTLYLERIDLLAQLSNYQNLSFTGYRVDVGGNGEWDYPTGGWGDRNYHYRTLGFATMPTISIDENGNMVIAYIVGDDDDINGSLNYPYNKVMATARDCTGMWFDDTIRVSQGFVHGMNEAYSLSGYSNGHDNTFWILYSQDPNGGLYLDKSDNYPESNGGDLTDNVFYAVKIVPALEGYDGVAEEAVNPLTTTRVYPNPATDVLNIEVNASQASEMSISVFNIMGQNVMNKTVNISTGINRPSISTSELNSGIYFVTVKANGFENTMKFIVK